VEQQPETAGIAPDSDIVAATPLEVMVIIKVVRLRLR
jgi:hypothetical protein